MTPQATAPAPARPTTRTSRRNAVLRSLASGVAVLTARSGERLHGTTVSTLTSVSRDPLVVGVCMRPGSILADLARAEGRFAVNVLRGDQGALARWFADPARPDGAGQFEGLDWWSGSERSGGAPLLAGTIAHLSCRLSSCVPVGDHEVLLGLVTEATADGGEPLLSYAGALHAPALYGSAPLPVPTAVPRIAAGEEGTPR